MDFNLDLYNDFFEYNGERKLTRAGIEYQAQNFWRDQEFYHVCCDEDNDFCSYEFVGYDTEGAAEERNLVIMNSCANRDGPEFTYYIKLFEHSEGGHNFAMYPYNPLEYPSCAEFLEGDLANDEGLSPLTRTEVDFWSQVAKLYRTIPSWMIDFDFIDHDELPWNDEEVNEEQHFKLFPHQKDLYNPPTWLDEKEITTWLDEISKDITLPFEQDADLRLRDNSYVSPFDGETK